MDITIDPLSAVANLIGTTVAGVTSYFNRKSQEKTNAANLSFAREENEITRSREDNAIQRAVTDAKAAGLSPLAAVDMGPASSSTGIMANQIAPQMDGATIAGLLSSFGNAIETTRHNKATEKQAAAELAEQTAEFDAQLSKEYYFEDQRHTEAMATLNNQLEKINNDMVIATFQNNLEKQKYLTKKSQEDMENFCKALKYTPRIEYVKDFDTYLDKWRESQQIYTLVLKKFEPKPDKAAAGTGYNTGESYDSGSNTGGTILGTGANAGNKIGESKTMGTNASASVDRSNVNDKNFIDALNAAGFYIPQYIGDIKGDW